MLNHCSLLYHSLSLVPDNDIISIIFAAAVCSTSAFACPCAWKSYIPAAIPLWFTSRLAATVNHLITAFGYRGKRHQLGYQLAIQFCPAHRLWKWEGRVCNMRLSPYHCLEVCPSYMISRCITCRRKSFRWPASREQRCTCFIAAFFISCIVYFTNELLGGLHCRIIQVKIA